MKRRAVLVVAGGVAAAVGVALSLAVGAAAANLQVTGASGSAASPSSSNVSVSFTINDGSRACFLYLNTDPGAAGPGAQVIQLGAGDTSWSGDGGAPGRTLYAQVASSDATRDPNCSDAHSLLFSNIVSFSIPAYSAGGDTTSTTTGSPTPAPPSSTTTAAPTTTTAGPSNADLEAEIQALQAQVTALQTQVDNLVKGQTVTMSARTWRVTTAKNGTATLVATTKLRGEKIKPKRNVPSTVLLPLLKPKR